MRRILRRIKRLIRDLLYSPAIIKNQIDFKSSYKRLREFENQFDGKRCFIIGNGPSLRKEDLEKLNNEITFATNGIYYIYDKTNWRPMFYCVQDSKLMNNRYKSEIKTACSDSINIFGLVSNWKYPFYKRDSIKIKLIDEHFGNEKLPQFSYNPFKGFYEGRTVTYFNIQLAVYMGFKEIYLLGVDHSYMPGQEHFSDKDVCDNAPRTDLTTLAYQQAKIFADKQGIKIVNCTRGGCLEIFERQSFDEVIGGLE